MMHCVSWPFTRSAGGNIQVLDLKIQKFKGSKWGAKCSIRWEFRTSLPCAVHRCVGFDHLPTYMNQHLNLVHCTNPATFSLVSTAFHRKTKWPLFSPKTFCEGQHSSPLHFQSARCLGFVLLFIFRMGDLFIIMMTRST